MFTYFLVGEDLSQRMRRMSVDKPELFLLTNNNRDEAAAAAAAPTATSGLPHAGSSESLNSHVLFDESNLPLVIVTNAQL